MSRALMLLTVLTTGCLIVPATKTSVRQVETEDGKATFTNPREVTVTTQVSYGALRVQAKRIGDCNQPVFAIDEVTTSKHAKLGGAEDPRARAFGFLLAPLTIPISAIITGFAVAADTPTTTRSTREIGVKRFACSLEADNLEMAFTLPSGATIKRTTTRDGRIDLVIPESEPYEGTIVMTATMAQPQQVAYALPKPPVSAARDAVLACAAEHRVVGSVTAKLSINAHGHATRLWLSQGDQAFNACVGKQVSGVSFPENTRGTTLAMPLTVDASAPL